MTPGASFRGLHDSIVNHLGNASPELLICIHEEHAVAIAHGYAKVTGEPLIVALHSNVGLMHAAMAIYNAWCDRVPMLIIGATGPLDAEKRRPWIDWIHTSQDQGQIIRSYCKWDDQPTSPDGALNSISRGMSLTKTLPHAPVYINCDTVLFEEEHEPANNQLIDGALDQTELPGLTERQLEQLKSSISGSKKIVILLGRLSRNQDDFDNRVRLAEGLSATVITDLRTGSTFPTDHDLHCPPDNLMPSEKSSDAIHAADLVLSFDWIDLGGILRNTFTAPVAQCPTFHFSLDQVLINGWSKDHCEPARNTTTLLVDPNTAVNQLVEILELAKNPLAAVKRKLRQERSDESLSMRSLASACYSMLESEKVTLIRTPISWRSEDWVFSEPLDHLGFDGGGGIGSGVGMAVGGALALKHSDRLPVAVLGDGDYLMGVSGLWTAVHHDIPLLIIVANNRSFFNDELHQERVAIARDRDVNNKGVGIRLDEPDVDLVGMATAQGCVGFGPIHTSDDLRQELVLAVEQVKAGKVVVIDARVSRSY
jgi:thiamine pyrophosphate-dependent acetolactate synthase large subunit-like protein